jgi:hypothetical protein
MLKGIVIHGTDLDFGKKNSPCCSTHETKVKLVSLNCIVDYAKGKRNGDERQNRTEMKPTPRT